MGRMPGSQGPQPSVAPSRSIVSGSFSSILRDRRIPLTSAQIDSPISSRSDFGNPPPKSLQTIYLYLILGDQYQYVILALLMGARVPSALPQVMRLHRAVPKIPTKS